MAIADYVAGHVQQEGGKERKGRAKLWHGARSSASATLPALPWPYGLAQGCMQEQHDVCSAQRAAWTDGTCMQHPPTYPRRPPIT